jgi:hypothetical protein
MRACKLAVACEMRSERQTRSNNSSCREQGNDCAPSWQYTQAKIKQAEQVTDVYQRVCGQMASK